MTITLDSEQSERLYKEAHHEAELMLVVDTLCAGIEKVDTTMALSFQAGIRAGITATLKALEERGVLECT